MDTDAKNGRKSCAAPVTFPNLLMNLRSKKTFARNGTGRIYSTRKSSEKRMKTKTLKKLIMAKEIQQMKQKF